MVGIIDYETGNIRSVENALKRLGAEYVLSSDRKILDDCDRILLPGVGEASWAMARLKERGMDDYVRSCTRPVLGICLGMQLLCSWSEEGNTPCLGIFGTRVRSFRKVISGESGLKIPHTGWNSISSLDPVLYKGVGEGSYVYFVHSYFAEPDSRAASFTEYGVEFSSSLRKDNFTGCQFHPEKSGEVGERIIANFLKM